jgi:CHAD domain-containing protein
MAFKFEIDEPFASEIPRIARERIERVVESLAEKPHPSAESIHAARKDLKSLRALLRLARGSITDETRHNENLLFRDTGRSLAAVRDSQALVEALKRFVKGRTRTGSKISAGQQKVRLDFVHQVRSRIEQEAVEELPEDTLKQLKENLHGAARNAAHWFDGFSFERENEWEAFVGRGLRRTYRQGREIVGQLESLGKENAGDETWHALRKNTKALGYQLRLFRPIWPELLGALLKEIDESTEKLGDDHDLAVLRGRLLTEPYDASETQVAAEIRRIFVESLDRRRRKLQTEAYQMVRRIYAEKPRQFESRIRYYWSISQKKAIKIFAQSPPDAAGHSSKRDLPARSSEGALHRPHRPAPASAGTLHRTPRRRVRAQGVATGSVLS